MANIKLIMISPIANMLEITESMATLKKELPYQENMTTGDIMECLADEYPSFAKVWALKESATLEKIVFAIDGNSLPEGGDKWNIDIPEGAEVTVMLPYQGGC